MKLPNSFRPEINLDKKTEQLIEESKVINSETNIRGIEIELEHVLNTIKEDETYYKKDEFHKDIEYMINKTSYEGYRVWYPKLSKTKEPSHIQWVMHYPDDTETILMLSRRRYGKEEKRYNFAVLNKKDLDKFSGILNSYLRWDNLSQKEHGTGILIHTFGSLVLGAMALGLFTSFFYYKPDFTTFRGWLQIFGGAGTGLIGMGVPSALIKQEFEKKANQRRKTLLQRLSSISYDLILDNDEAALQQAFK